MFGDHCYRPPPCMKWLCSSGVASLDQCSVQLLSLTAVFPSVLYHSDCSCAAVALLPSFTISVSGSEHSLSSMWPQSEDGADHDSAEEATPASPHSKRRVGRPGRKRKQLLPVSAVIIARRWEFFCFFLCTFHLFSYRMFPLSNLSYHTHSLTQSH